MANFILRPWHINDIEDLVTHANNFKVAKNMNDGFPFPYTIVDAKNFIEYSLKVDPIHIFAIEVNNKAAGGIGIHPQTDIYKKNAELGYWLAEDFWGKGIVTGAVKQMIEFAFKTYDIDRLFARPFSSNLSSQRVLEKAGFILEGRFEKAIFKNGEYLDEMVYAIRRK